MYDSSTFDQPFITWNELYHCHVIMSLLRGGWGCSVHLMKDFRPSSDGPQEVKCIFDVQLGNNAPRGTSGQGKGHLLGCLKKEQCWLEFLVQGYE